jgi:hypothetical protein
MAGSLHLTNSFCPLGLVTFVPFPHPKDAQEAFYQPGDCHG